MVYWIVNAPILLKLRFPAGFPGIQERAEDSRGTAQLVSLSTSDALPWK